ncbi:unnamed protein product, partial [Didymodactylos carnosus]
NYDVFRNILLNDITLVISTKDDGKEIIRLDDYYVGYKTQQYSFNNATPIISKSDYNTDDSASTIDPTSACTLTFNRSLSPLDQTSNDKNMRIQMLSDVVLPILSQNSATNLLFEVIINSRSLDVLNINDDDYRPSRKSTLTKKWSQQSNLTDITTINCRLTLKNTIMTQESLQTPTSDTLSSITNSTTPVLKWHHLIFSEKNDTDTSDQQLLLLNQLQFSKAKFQLTWTDFLKKLLLTNNDLFHRMQTELSKNQKWQSNEHINVYLLKW